MKRSLIALLLIGSLLPLTTACELVPNMGGEQEEEEGEEEEEEED